MEDDVIEEGIISAIRAEKAEMRPRWFFVFRAVIVVVLIAIFLLLLLYLVSFILFALRQNGVWFAPGFGLTGLFLFLVGAPWGLILLSFVLLAILVILFSRYSFVYRKPLSLLLFLLFFLITLGSFLIAATSFHTEVFRYAENDNVFPVGRFYEYESETSATSRVHREEIVAIASSSFIVVDTRGVTSVIVADPGVVLGDSFRIGETVVVLGARDSSGTINASGAKVISP
jgi:hypothetical protein